MTTVVPVLVDPMALLLPSSVYPKWAEGKHPHLPSVAEMSSFMKSMTGPERSETVERAKTLETYAGLVSKAAAKV